MKCPVCGSEDVRYDAHTNEYFCGVCGYVFSGSEIDLENFSVNNVIPLGGTGRRKRDVFDNKNDVSTYRLLQLQKIKTYVYKEGLPDVVYWWTVKKMKSYDGQWRFPFLVATLYLSILKHGLYRSVDEIASYFGIKKGKLYKYIHEASKVFGVDYRVGSKRMLSYFISGEDRCVKCCSKFIIDNVGEIDFKYGLGPRIVALTIIFMCRLYCHGDIVLSRFLKDNLVPSNSLMQSIYRIFKEFGVVEEQRKFGKKDVLELMEVVMNGRCRFESE